MPIRGGESASDAPQKAAGYAHQPKITAFGQLEASVRLVCVINTDENHLAGVAGQPKWEISDCVLAQCQKLIR